MPVIIRRLFQRRGANDNGDWLAIAEQMAFATGRYDQLSQAELDDIERRARQTAGQRLRSAQEVAATTAAARLKARELLLSFLDPDQRRDFEKTRGFNVEVGGRNYRVFYGRAGNIHVIEGGLITKSLCVHPADPELPVEDVMLAQLLHLRHDDLDLVRTANVTHFQSPIPLAA